MRSSPACWARYGEILAREFGDPDYFALHQVTVDTYAAQHPGVAERRAIQSVGLHLMTLCVVLEDGADPREGPKLHRRMVRRPAFAWLDPPSMDGRLTVADVLPAENPSEHGRLVRAWAETLGTRGRPIIKPCAAGSVRVSRERLTPRRGGRVPALDLELDEVLPNELVRELGVEGQRCARQQVG